MSAGITLPQRPIPPILGFRGGDSYGFGYALGPGGVRMPAFQAARLRVLEADARGQAAAAARAATWLPLVQAAAGQVAAQGLMSLENAAAAVKEMASQAWGYLDRPRLQDVGNKPPRAFPNQELRGNYSATGRTRIDCSYTFVAPRTDGGPSYVSNQHFQWIHTGVVGAYFWGEGGTQAAPYFSRLSFIKADGGQFDDPGIFGGGYSNPAAPWSCAASFTFTALEEPPVPLNGAWGTGVNLQPVPFTPGRIAEVETAQPLPSKPAPMPAYLPGLDPAAVPDAVPVEVPQTEPGEEGDKTKKPVIAPPVTPTITPSRGPVSPVRVPKVPSKLGADGKQLPIPFPKPAPTPVDDHYVNGKPITTGQPRTDLESIAKEVGRIESKTAIALEQMAGPAGALDKLLDLYDLLEKIQKLLDATTPGGEFEMKACCDTDSNKKLITVKVPYAGGSALDRIESKVGALAQLLQVHKNLKQPVCTFKAPNSNVTVTFHEVLEVEP